MSSLRATAVIVTLFLGLPHVCGAPIENIFATGHLLPMREGNEPLDEVWAARLNNQGQVAVLGDTTGITAAVWVHTPGVGVTLVSQDGDLAPGTIPDIDFAHDDDETFIWLNDIGQVLIRSEAMVSDTTGARTLGYWLWEQSGTLLPIYQTAAQVPDMPSGSEFADTRSGTLTNAGAAVNAEVRSAGSEISREAALWWTSGGLELLALDRTVAAADDGGQVVLQQLASEATDPPTVPGLWLVDTQSERPPLTVVAPGQELPGTEPLAPLFNLSGSQVTDMGTVFFLDNARVQDGLWRAHRGVLDPIVVAGDELSEGPVTNVLSFSANDQDDVAFWARVDSGRDGIWVVTDNTTATVVMEGQEAPGIADSCRFQRFLGVELNERGQVAFSALIDERPAGGDRSIWATDISGTLRLVAREGEFLEIAPGDKRLVTMLRGWEFNDNGQVLFSARFEDSTSGVFLSHVVAVPEPSTSVLLFLSLATLGLLGRQQRRRNGRGGSPFLRQTG